MKGSIVENKNSRLYLSFFLAIMASVILASLLIPLLPIGTPDRLVPEADEELGEVGVVVEYGEEDDVYHFRQKVFHPDGKTPRIVKTVLKNQAPFLSPSGNYVFYQYHREDGTLEKAKVVFPYVSLGASVLARSKVVHYDVDGVTPLLEQYIREDGTIGCEIDKVAMTFTIFRADGKTLRYQQVYDGSDLQITQYRLDGKTVWWQEDFGNDHIDVYFDREGNPFERRLDREYLFNGSFSMSAKDPPIKYCQDSFSSPDGVLEYRQTWYHGYDEKLSAFKDILAKVEVYSQDGSRVVKEYVLDVDKLDSKSISMVVIHNDDGTRLVRTYRSNGSRESEELFDGDDNLLKSQHFTGADSFVEAFESYYFHALGGTDPYGIDDDDSNDI